MQQLRAACGAVKAALVRCGHRADKLSQSCVPNQDAMHITATFKTLKAAAAAAAGAKPSRLGSMLASLNVQLQAKAAVKAVKKMACKGGRRGVCQSFKAATRQGSSVWRPCQQHTSNDSHSSCGACCCCQCQCC
jgi:hypothetical protein